MISAAWWGLGYGALLVAVVAYGRHFLQHHIFRGERASPVEQMASQRVGESLVVVSTVLLGTGVVSRALRGHGWPIVSAADAAAGMAVLVLLLQTVWVLTSRRDGPGLAAASIALLLLSYGLARVPVAPVVVPFRPVVSILSEALNLAGGALLALAAAFSLAAFLSARLAGLVPIATRASLRGDDPASEMMVRAALLCLAVSLAVDTWWLQKVELGRAGEAQQAGIAIVWMVYFVALRLRSSPRWRGWPWASVLLVGFACALPILIDVPWLALPLPV
jgi:uncharacterized membrane protein